MKYYTINSILTIILVLLVWNLFSANANTFEPYTLEESNNSPLYIDYELSREPKYNDDNDIKLEYDYLSKGVVDLLYNLESDKNAKIIISQGKKKYTYDIKNSNQFVYLPLQLGTGNYTIEIYEHVTESKYTKIFSDKIEVDIDDDRAVYLNTIQVVGWTNDLSAVQLSDRLVKKLKEEKEYVTDRDIIELIYSFIIENIDYDFDKISSLTYDYIPNIDDVLNDGKGICYDYSALLASMLRSQEIPVKLIKGYSTTTDVYHAWNEIYIEDENIWIIVDTTIDAYKRMFEEVTLEKPVEDYKKEYEY